VVGYSYLPDRNFRGFYWINGKMTAMGTLGGDWSQAYAINDSGQITGTAYTKGNVADHAFIFQNGAMKDFGTLTGTISVGTAINTSGAVVDTRRCGARANSWCITRSFIAGRG